jgi:hypothetical protein
MRIVASLAVFALLTAPTVADVAPKLPFQQKPPAPSAPGAGSNTPGGFYTAQNANTPGPATPTRSDGPSMTAATTSPEALASLSDIPVDDPADRPADSDPRKLIGAIALVLGVYAATRLLRRKPSDAKP